MVPLIVVPTYNEALHIESVVKFLLSEGAKFDRFTLVVADGGSRDGTVDIVRAMAAENGNLKLLNNHEKLQSAGVNHAVEQYGAGHDVLVRCDAHGGYPEGFVERLVAALEAQACESVVVPMDSVGETCVQKANAWVANTLVGTGGSAHRAGLTSGFVDHGHHAAIRLDMFRRAGGYDSSFSHNEDAEFDCRLRALGGRIFLNAEIRKQYYPRATLSALAKQYYNYGRGRSRTVRKHRGSMRLRQLALPMNFLAEVLCLVLGLIVSPIFLVLPALYLSAVLANAVHIAVQERSACGLMAFFSAIIMHNAWSLGFLGGLLLAPQQAWTSPEAKALGRS